MCRFVARHVVFRVRQASDVSAAHTCAEHARSSDERYRDRTVRHAMADGIRLPPQGALRGVTHGER